MELSELWQFQKLMSPLWISIFFLNWNFWYGLLEQYVKEYGNALVPLRFKTKDGYLLGQWVSTNRTAEQRKTLSKDRKEKLKKL